MDTVTNILDPNGNSKPTRAKELSDMAAKILQEQGSEALEAFMKDQGEKLKTARTNDTKSKTEPKNSQEAPPNNPRNPSLFQGAVPDITAQSTNLSESIEKVIQKAPVDRTQQPTVKAVTVADTMKILQPKSVVFGRYQLTEWQENVMTIIMERLQGYMSRSINVLKPDILGEITVRIDCREVAGDDKKKAIAQIEKMMDYKFEFWWQNNLAPEGTKHTETKGTIISTYHNHIGTSYVDLTINKWAAPFLVYYGPGIGANRYTKHTALALPGKYTKRIYKIITGYIDKGKYDFRLEDLRKDFRIPESYTNAQIKRSIITPAVEDINAYDTEIRLSAEFICLNKNNKGTKPTMDTVRFTIEKKVQEERPYTPEPEMRKKVTEFLSPLLEEPFRSKLPSIVYTWQNHGDLGFVYAKVIYYEKMVATGKMSPQKMKNFLLKAISDETHVQLRKSNRRKIQNNG